MRSIFILLLFVATQIVAQDNTYTATYSFEFLISSELKEKVVKNETEAYLYKSFLRTQKGAKHISIILNIKGNESYSFIKPIMDVDNLSLKSVISASGYRKPIYTNNTTSEVLIYNSETFFPEHEYIIGYDKLNTQWKLTNDSKIINGYKCYKAKGVYSIENNDKKFEDMVIAWYCPDIPASFGPYGYGKLPGLIIDLQVTNKHYVLNSIRSKDKKKMKIVTPTKGKKIMNKKYQTLVKEIVQGKI